NPVAGVRSRGWSWWLPSSIRPFFLPTSYKGPFVTAAGGLLHSSRRLRAQLVPPSVHDNHLWLFGRLQHQQVCAIRRDVVVRVRERAAEERVLEQRVVGDNGELAIGAHACRHDLAARPVEEPPPIA